MTEELWTSSQLTLQDTAVTQQSSDPKLHADPDPSLPYGWFKFRPKCLQRLRNPKWLLFWLCWAGAIQGMVVNGFVNVMITTIEKRFELRSTDTGLIAGAYDLASFLCLIPVSYFGGSGNKARWLGWGVALMGLGSLLFALPHFVIPPYVPINNSENGAGLGLLLGCANQSSKCDISDKPSLANFKYVFFLAQLLHGAGASPLYTLGVTFLDESVPTKMSSVYIGIYYAMAIFGPAVGYLVGGQLLQVYVDIGKSNIPGHLNPSSSLWIGAWWIGFIISGICSLIFALPILGFPPQLPGWREIRLGKVSEARLKASHLNTVNRIGFGSSISHLPQSLKILAANPTFIFLSLAGAFEIMLLNGFAAFLPKFFESQFSLSSSWAAFLVGIVTVVGGGGGTLLGGYVIKRWSMNCSEIIRLCAILTAVALLTCFIFVTNCPNAPFSGVNHSLNSSCSLRCNCSRQYYDPVCGSDDVTYFSPCFAGCLDSSKMADEQQVFTDCSCVTPSEENSRSKLNTATRETCGSECSSMPLFLSITFLFVSLTFIASMPALSATLRCVDENQKSFALGVQWMVARMLGSIPAPVLFGACMDQACILWQSQCDFEQGYCRYYNNQLMSRLMLAISVSAKVIATACFTLALYVYKAPQSVISSTESPSMVVHTVSSNVPYVSPSLDDR